MITLQTVFGHDARRAGEPRDHSRLLEFARVALGIAILLAVLAAAVAIRVLVYVPL